MSFFQWAQNPWGQEVLVRISWDLFYLVAAAAALFVIGHLVFRAKNKEGEPVAVEGPGAASLPERIVRHPMASRFFHWTMSIAMFALLITGFLPVLGVHFEWLTIHWVAGLVLIGLVVFHIIHSVFFMNLKNVWISSQDWAEFKQEAQHVLSGGKPPPKPGKYPVDQKLFHNLVTLAALGVIVTGFFMLFRVDAIFARNPYMFSDSTWGLIYVLHGLSAVGLVGFTIAHVYFAVLPEKRWMTISMIAGWITKKDYLAHHDPARWVVTEKAES